MSCKKFDTQQFEIKYIDRGNLKMNITSFSLGLCFLLLQSLSRSVALFY